MATQDNPFPPLGQIQQLGDFIKKYPKITVRIASSSNSLQTGSVLLIPIGNAHRLGTLLMEFTKHCGEIPYLSEVVRNFDPARDKYLIISPI
jgi:hypothetical protein